MKTPSKLQYKLMWWFNLPAILVVFTAFFLVWAWNIPFRIYFRHKPSEILHSLPELMIEVYEDYFEYPA
jgi:hypothetical protein